jgi:hypothetical protein
LLNREVDQAQEEKLWLRPEFKNNNRRHEEVELSTHTHALALASATHIEFFQEAAQSLFFAPVDSILIATQFNETRQLCAFTSSPFFTATCVMRSFSKAVFLTESGSENDI